LLIEKTLLKRFPIRLAIIGIKDSSFSCALGVSDLIISQKIKNPMEYHHKGKKKEKLLYDL
jgi:hypothetical protein